MRRFGLNGWQRIGVVLALVWMVIGGSWGWRHAYDKADAEFRVCIAGVKTVADVQACRDTRFRAIAVPRGVSAAIVALAPLTVVGLLIYGLVWLGRRIKRAFSPEPSRVGAGRPPPTAPNAEPIFVARRSRTGANGARVRAGRNRPANGAGPCRRRRYPTEHEQAHRRTIHGWLQAIRSPADPVMPDRRR